MLSNERRGTAMLAFLVPILSQSAPPIWPWVSFSHSGSNSHPLTADSPALEFPVSASIPIASPESHLHHRTAYLLQPVPMSSLAPSVTRTPGLEALLASLRSYLVGWVNPGRSRGIET